MAEDGKTGSASNIGRGATESRLVARRHTHAGQVDIGLPEINGYDVARRLRSLPELERVTLVAFTGYGQDEDRRRVREAGFDYHLVKPAAAAELAKIIDALPMRSQGT